MKVRREEIKGVLLKYLTDGGLNQFVNGFDVSDADYSKFLGWAHKQHPSYSDEEKRAWALYSALTHVKPSNEPVLAGETLKEALAPVPVVAKTIHVVHTSVEAFHQFPAIKHNELSVSAKLDKVEANLVGVPSDINIHFKMDKRAFWSVVVWAFVVLVLLLFLTVKSARAQDRGIGNAGVGTPRVVLASDQPTVAVSFASGTVTANQGTAGTHAQRWPTCISDGVSACVTVTAGRLIVNCEVGCGASSFADNSAFTGGTTAISISGAIYDTTPPAIADGSAGAFRMNSSRILLVDGSGATQPVSGTLTAVTSITNAVTVTDGAGALNVIVDSGTTAVTQATASNLNAQVQGPAADGAAVSGNPVRVGFKDSAGNTQDWQGNTTGTPALTGAFTGADNIANTAIGLMVEGAGGSLGLLGVAGWYFDGTAWDRVQGTSADGLLVNLGANNDVTVTSGTINIGTFPDNEPFNVAQINGVTPLMGNGATGTGSQRVTIASDNSAVAGMGVGATGSAVPANANYIAGTNGTNLTGYYVDPCQREARTFTPVDIVTATTTVITTATASNRVYICSITLFSAGTQNAAVVEGTGGSCGTGTAGVMGGATAAEGFNFTAQTGIAFGNGQTAIAATAGTNVDLCIISSAAVQLSGVITWVKEP